MTQKTDSIDNQRLLGLEPYLINFIKLYNNKKFPKVTMLSGLKGIGKYTLITHLMSYILDKSNYNLNNFERSNTSDFNLNFKNKMFDNIIFINKEKEPSIKIETIRELKNKLTTTILNNKPRFIIIDEVENLNINSSNALLKIIEEPSENNFFILINNQTKVILDTVMSRAINFRINLKEVKRIEIIEKLIQHHKITNQIDFKNSYISPGNFFYISIICEENKINLDDEVIKTNVEKILSLYSKQKDYYLIILLKFLFTKFFNNKIKKNFYVRDVLFAENLKIFREIHEYLSLNLNTKMVINSIISKL